MQSPLLAEPSSGTSPGCRPKRARCSTDEEATFLLDGSNAAQLQAAIDARIGPEISKRCKASLQETLDDIAAEYPQEDLPASRRRANSELSDYVEKQTSRRSSRVGSCAASPASLHPRGSPEITLPDVLENPSQLILPSAAEETLFYEHEGLYDHEQLVQALYLSEGLDFFEVQNQAKNFLKDIGLRPHDLGVQNIDEEGRTLMNQCFYLSIAHAYLGHAFAEEVCGLALRLKRAIEAAVLIKRPDWASGPDGEFEEKLAFGDFLPIVMHASDAEDEPNLLAELAVCIMDSVNGHVEVYIGPKYAKQDSHEVQQRNLILLWYTPGHYQCLVCDDLQGSKVQMSYDEFKDVLTKHGVMYIETTE